MVALLHLHGVAQGAGGAGNDCDFLYWSRVGLLGGHQSVADLVIGNRPFLLICQDGIFLLIAGDHNLNALLQIRLGRKASTVPHSPQGCLVDDVGQLRSAGAGGHPCHLQEVHVLRHFDFFGVNF